MEALGLGDGFVLAFVQVVLIDLAMSGDNAIIIGLAVAGLPAENRTRIIFWGVAGATVLRMGFAAVTTELLEILGLTLAGGLLLLRVAWRLYRELRAKGRSEHGNVAGSAAPKTPRQAMLQIIAEDVSMSLDNVLAVAGAARPRGGAVDRPRPGGHADGGGQLHRPHPRPPSPGRLDRLRHHPVCRRRHDLGRGHEVVAATRKA